MAIYKLLMPKMGESVIEATILSWNKKVGDAVVENEVVLEVATDKVDTDVPSEVSGIIQSILHEEGSVVAVGEILALIETDKDTTTISQATITTSIESVIRPKNTTENNQNSNQNVVFSSENNSIKNFSTTPETQNIINNSNSNTQFSPLVLNIAKVENISLDELKTISGSGLDGRLTKHDVLKYLETRKINNDISSTNKTTQENIVNNTITPKENKIEPTKEISTPPIKKDYTSPNEEIMEMDRIRKIIAKNMLDSRKTSAHVSSFVECDVTKIVKWREKYKNSFKSKYGFNLTYLPVFIEAIAQCIKEFPNINVSISDEKIIVKKDINIGIATALPNGNLIVPVIKNADRKNILGLASEINLLAQKARNNQLTTDDISNGTYTVSNIGTFGNILGTPIILQPQVAIMAVGVATKKPVVIDLNGEDVIAIRHMMYLSHTYDHRIVDGMLGGMFVKRVAEILENFDDTQEI